MDSFVTIAFEGTTDEPLVRRLLSEVDLPVGAVYLCNGKARIDARLASWNHAARFNRWFVLRDLDQDAACAAEFVGRILPEPAAWMCFRLAVRESEAWLLGDRERAAAWLGVPVGKLPREPELEPDPKRTLIELARRSRHRSIVEDIVPAPGSTARVGRGYAAQVADFVSSRWLPVDAAERCPSLASCLSALRRLARRR